MEYFINTSKSAKKIRSVTCQHTHVGKYQCSSKSRGCRKKSRYMNMDKVICIGYFVAGYKKNNGVFLHWQHREKCPVYQAGWSGRQMFRTAKIA